MPNAKGLFSEQHTSSMGTYWGVVSSPGCREIVGSADCYLFAGPTFTDYTTVGHTLLVDDRKLIEAAPNTVKLPGQSYNNIRLRDFLTNLAPKLKRNNSSLVAFDRIREKSSWPSPGAADAPLSTRQMFGRIQTMLNENSAVVAETGDSWFNGMALSLPEGCEFAVQMQYGSIGWSVRRDARLLHWEVPSAGSWR